MIIIVIKLSSCSHEKRTTVFISEDRTRRKLMAFVEQPEVAKGFMGIVTFNWHKHLARQVSWSQTPLCGS